MNKSNKSTETDHGAIGRDKPSALGGRAVFLGLLTGFWFFSAVNPTRTNDFSPHDVIAIGILTGGVIFLQLIIVATLTATRTARRWVNLVFALAAATNLYYLLLVVEGDFITLPTAAQFGLWMAAGGGAWLLFSAISENRRWQIGALIIGSVLFAQAAGTQAVYQLQIIDKIGGTATNIAVGDITSAANVRTVGFVHRPNVYFLSFDGMAPGAIVGDFFQKDNLQYENTLRRHGFRPLENHFANGNLTRPALNQMLALDPAYYRKVQNEQASHSPLLSEYMLVSGLTPTPMWEIFRANGYTTYAFAYDQFFGPHKGPHVDNYLIPAGFSACSTMIQDHVVNAFFHYCYFLGLAYHRKWIDPSNHQVLLAARKHRDSDVDRLLAVISEITDSEQPSVLLSYLAIPGHSRLPYLYRRPETHSIYRAAFAAGEIKTAEAINRIMRLIKSKDPEAIVYIFGDHGAFLTNGIQPHDIHNEEQAIFLVRDRYGAYGGVWPADACQESFDQPFSPNAITPAEVARHVIRCLAGGQDPIIAPINYPVYYERSKKRDRIKLDDSFDKYRYE